MKIIIAIVTAATLWPAVLSAADAQSEVKWKKDIATCVEKVRRETIDKSFDAYVTPRGQLRWFGFPEANFQFEKCMAEKGWDIRDVDK